MVLPSNNFGATVQRPCKALGMDRIMLLIGFAAALVLLPYHSRSTPWLKNMEAPMEIDLIFLTAVARGNLQQLQKIVAVFENGEGRGKVPYAKLKTPQGLYALHVAAGVEKTGVSRFLIDKLNFDINGTDERTGETPLFHAIDQGHQYTTVFLIENGVDVTKRNHLGETPLHHAARRGSKEMVKLLIAKGADLNAVSHQGTPLYYAALHGKCDVLKYLLSLKADPNIITSSPEPPSPLYASMIARSRECLELLLEAGADPNQPCNLATPLRFAAGVQDIGIVRSLLKAGADPNIVDTVDNTPLEHAALICRRDVVELLFPVTSPIASYPDWSIRGVMQHATSEEAKKLFNSKLEKVALLAKAKGDETLHKKIYVNAANWYIQADEAGRGPTDVEVLLNRSLCYTKIKAGESALADALACIALKPYLPMAHYREGEAWNVLSNYKKAAEAFSRASALAPGNKEMEAAYVEAQAKRDMFRHWNQY